MNFGTFVFTNRLLITFPWTNVIFSASKEPEYIDQLFTNQYK